MFFHVGHGCFVVETLGLWTNPTQRPQPNSPAQHVVTPTKPPAIHRETSKNVRHGGTSLNKKTKKKMVALNLRNLILVPPFHPLRKGWSLVLYPYLVLKLHEVSVYLAAGATKFPKVTTSFCDLPCDKPFGCFLQWWYPQIIHFNRVFHYKPSILGYHHFRKHPFGKKLVCGHKQRLHWLMSHGRGFLQCWFCWVSWNSSWNIR